MGKLFGWVLIIGGIALGLWLGVWVMFVGGIVEFINGIKQTPVDATMVGCGIVRVMFAGFVGWLSGVISIGIGLKLI